jgi:hypothetical protein
MNGAALFPMTNDASEASQMTNNQAAGPPALRLQALRPVGVRLPPAAHETQSRATLQYPTPPPAVLLYQNGRRGSDGLLRNVLGVTPMTRLNSLAK